MTIAERTRPLGILFGLLLLVAWLAAILPQSPTLAANTPKLPTERSVEATEGEKLLASVMIRRARGIIQTAQPSVDGLDLARRLARMAVELDPENLHVVRTALTIAETTEDIEFRDDLIARVARLDPSDQVIRLARLRMAMDRFQTAEERISRYERLLSDANIDQIGRPEASRLALDLALLYRRQGNTPKFAEWLGRSTAIDQAHKAAAGMAAGYFRMQVDDPFAEAEMLINLLMADPTDLVSYAALARHLLDHGAYEGAARLYSIAAEAQESMDRLGAHGMVADRAIALWGAGRPDAAADVLRDRQRYFDEQARQAARRERPEMSATERQERIRSAPPVTMNTVQIALRDRAGDAIGTAEWLGMLMQSLRLAHDAMLEAEANPDQSRPRPTAEDRVENLLQRALHLLWFGTADNVSTARDFVRQANELKPLSDRAMARFEGLALFREGSHTEALATLEPIMADDLPARMGAAMVYRAMGRDREAARTLLEIARGAAGTVVGVWAKDRLETMLGERLPPTELAGRLNRLVAQLPAHVDRFATDPASTIALRIEPVAATYKPYEPVILQLELTNRANYAIEIGSETALKSRLILEPTLTMVGQPRIDQTAPIVVSLGQRLRLNPRERVVIELDLRHYPVADLFDQFAIMGASVNLKGTTNFIITTRATVQPGIGGVIGRSPLVRIDGVRISREWVSAALDDVSRDGPTRHLATLGLLGRTLWIPRGEETPESTELYDRTRRTIIEAFGRMSPAEQAWLLSTMPSREPSLESIRQIARTIDNKLVRISYLLHHVAESRDPMLDAAARSGDDDVRALGAVIRETLLEAERQRNPLN